MSPARRLALALLGLMLLIGLTTALQAPVRQFIVEPANRLLALGRTTLTSLPQMQLWAAALVMGAWFALRGFSSPPPMPDNLTEPEAVTPARIESWYLLIGGAKRGAYFRWRLARGLADLALQVLAYRSRLNAHELSTDREQSFSDFPESIASFLRFGSSARTIGLESPPRIRDRDLATFSGVVVSEIARLMEAESEG